MNENILLNAIKMTMKSEKISVYALQKKTNLPYATIYGNCSYETISRICSALDIPLAIIKNGVPIQCLIQEDNEMKKFHWINSRIVLDFPIPNLLRELFQEAEKNDQNENYSYFAIADAIDDTAKGYYAAGRFTKDQWERISERYPCR